MILMGGVGMTGLGRTAIAPGSYAVSAILVVGGLALFLRKPFSFWVAIVAAGVLLVSGIAGFLHHPELGLPVNPAISVVVGIYLCLRVVIAKSALSPKKPRGFLPEEQPK
jgi:hypothetical protein